MGVVGVVTCSPCARACLSRALSAAEGKGLLGVRQVGGFERERASRGWNMGWRGCVQVEGGEGV